jgi:2-methylcitrate dehydratase PrpD
MASGLFAYLEDGTDTKPVHPAWAAHGAIVAARLASFGAEGPPHVLEGRFGLYDAFLQARDTVDLDAAFGDLGTRWETPRIAYKPYPACHYIHGSLGATRSLVGQLDPAEIEQIVVDVPEAGVALVLEPEASKWAPRTPYEAKFSLQYSTAYMLVHGQVGVGSYTDEAIGDARVLELARRVRYEVKEYPGSEAAFPGGVRVVLKDGRTLDASLPFQLGGPENPMSAADVSEKFRLNASLALDDADVERLEQAILGIEDETDLHGALAPLAARRAVTA